MTDDTETLREKDRAVLSHILEGRNDTHEITQATTLADYEVRYSFGKLEDHGLIRIEKPDGMVERTVDGQKRVFKAPHQAHLTDKAKEYLEQTRIKEDAERFEDMSREELVEKIRDHEDRIDRLETAVEMLKASFQQQFS